MTKKKRDSALEEIQGIDDPQGINLNLAKNIKAKRQTKQSLEHLTSQIAKGDIAALSRGITLIESNKPTDIIQAKQLIKSCLSKSEKSIRVGITGVPGVGKSTFIESYGNYLVDSGKNVAVLAVDPSSSLSKGSILGDKTRMETLVRRQNVFIRPTSAGSSLGGVARKTRETIVLCEAAGFDYIIIETVGVGQSETIVHSMVDFFLLLKLANAGDELQGIKKGIMEMADLIVINKADGENLKSAKIAQTEFKRALSWFVPKEDGIKPEVLLSSGLKNTGIKEVNDFINDYLVKTKASGFFNTKRFNQQLHWLKQTLEDHLLQKFYSDPKIEKELKNQTALLKQNKTTAFEAAEFLISL